MKRRTYAVEEQQELRNNPNVLACTDKTITYSEDFKRFVLHGYYEEGRSPRDMFAEGGFPESIVHSPVPKWTLVRWRRKYGAAYTDADLGDKRGTGKKGGRPRNERVDVSNMTDKEKIEYFEARAAYLDKENDFLAETRGLKRWPQFDWIPGKSSH